MALQIRHAAVLELKTHESVRDIGKETWDRLATGAPPFLDYCWFEALELSGCVRPSQSWAPLYLTLWHGPSVVAAAPAFVKTDSAGEFVFDQEWAAFSEAHALCRYYPKLVLAVPFTPATGPRLLVDPQAARGPVVQAFVRAVRSLVDTRGWSSAHVLFPSAEETEELVAAGLVHRTSLQFHWNNAGYASFDDFLSRFRAKRRAQIRRERRALLEQGISLETRTGKNIDEEVVEAVFRFYRSTVEAKFPWGRQYLNRDFFFRICDTMPSRIHIVLARQRVSQRCVGGALNLLGDRVLYGRYWGATEHRAFLHFNVCYYHGIEECIVRNLSRFEPGAGGEHKLARGFVPAETHSAHYLRDPVLDAAVRDFTRRERAAVRAAIARWKLGYRG